MTINKSAEIQSSATGKRRARKEIRRLCKWAAVALVLAIIGAVSAGAIYLKWFARANDFSTTQLHRMIAWRVKLFADKARGDIPQMSWTELLQMAKHRGGFGLEGFVDGANSFSGTIDNPYNSDKDRAIASHIFEVQCAQCHGQKGVGGIGPPLNQPNFDHGNSELSIYEILRDGIPGTAMRPQSLSMAQRWQLVAYIRQLQFHASTSNATKRPLKIKVTGKQLVSANRRASEWLTYSGSLEGDRYTPLKQITIRNVSKLRLRWVRQFDGARPHIEATPIVADGILFTTNFLPGRIAVDAVNAKSGGLVWRYTRRVSPEARGCCGRVNRGLAILGNYLYLASFDGYLACINADDGKQVWQTKVADPSHAYSLTMAPLIVNQSVVVGVAGGEYGIRGFLAAYDARTGKNLWRFNTVPGPGEPGHQTWSGNSWKTGGGPPWVTGSYDPSLGLIYWGVGNPSPDFSGASRAGDNLYTESVIALHANTGQLVWYFQFTPHDTHDWDSAQTPILADLTIQGKKRKVICWPNRNGFYYVLDRKTGRFLAGIPFVNENWATGLAPSGRPILTDIGKRSNNGQPVKPASSGAVNFQNAAFDNYRGLIFLPTVDAAEVFTTSVQVKYKIGERFSGSGAELLGTRIPVVRAVNAATGIREWQYYSPRHAGFSYSGLLATGGGLVFGASGGSAFALDSGTGRQVWRVFLGGDTVAAPISFTVDGRQVIAISAGNSLFLFGL